MDGDSATRREGGAKSRKRLTDLTAGEKVGRYEVRGVAGRGGMGIVYLAHDPQLDRQVALKLLLPSSDDADALVNEARALAKLTDPHVVAVYDAGEVDGRVFVAMQYVAGETLQEAIVRRQPPSAQILAWFVAAGRGLAAAHAAGLVHRDFKPGNVLIDSGGRIAVTDFGLAHDIRRGATDYGPMSGTPAYMAPEQYERQPATEASDQFSFCVALWEALFGRHPFATDPASMSLYELGEAITEGDLLPPLRKGRVDTSVIAALTRGLARDPAARWPTMAELLGVLAPKSRARVWPLVVAGGAAAVIAGGVVWAVVSRDDADRCQAQANARLSTAWAPARAAAIATRFAATGRPYADKAARLIATSFDGYAARWSSLTADVCAAARTSAASTDLIERRRACLDGRLDALRGLAGLLGTESRPELVDRAHALADSLPDLGDCVGEGVADTPPAAVAAEVQQLERDLAAAEARSAAGDYVGGVTAAAPIVARADQLHWAPLQVRARYAIGNAKLSLLQPAREELVEGARIAVANHLDRDASRALALAQLAAGTESQAEAVATLAPMARAAAERTGDKALIATAEIKHARALLRLRKWRDGAAACRAALELARSVDRRSVLDEARDCMVESLMPLEELDEVETLLAQVIADRTHERGADHPTIADYLRIRVTLHRRKGRLADARKDAERALEIRKRVFGERHSKVAEAIGGVADVLEAEGNAADADTLRREALALLDETKREHLTVLMATQASIATRECQGGKRPQCLERFEHLAQVVRKHTGNSSLELAILLLNYGQAKASDNVEAGLGLINEARDILERLGDRRVVSAGVVAAMIAQHAERWPDAVRFAEETLPLLGTDLQEAARTKWVLARALRETRGDRQRIRTLAEEARQGFVTLGPAFAGDVESIDEFLANR
ncbi:MAG TPA: serine/threonine-protein kinase [Kofleriaceae bacterium]